MTPEDKYKVVQALRDNGHVVGMTGDGVNDVPIFEDADVGTPGIDATEAARAAANVWCCVVFKECLSM